MMDTSSDFTRTKCTISAVRSVSRNSLVSLGVGVVFGFCFAYTILNVNVSNGYASIEIFQQQASPEQVLASINI